MKLFRSIFCVSCILAFTFLVQPAGASDRVTILYDAFGNNPALTRDWGFSALVEHDGKRILFDTGNNEDIFEHNVKALKVDLTHLDFVVVSHRHADHATGLKYLLKVNPDVTVYVPADGSNGFGGGAIPASFFRPETSLSAKMRYFDGDYPTDAHFGKLYNAGHFVLVDKLAYCRFSFRDLRTPPAETPIWVQRWVKPILPNAIRIEMAPLAPDLGRLQPVTLTIPVHVTRLLLPTEPYDN